MEALTEFKTYNILVVEDNPGDFALVEDFLSSQPDEFTLHHVKTFKQAKLTLTEACNTFDAILLDLSLPDKNGLPLISEMTGLCHNIPVIVLTGYTDVNFGVKSLSLGVSDYLLKDELSATILHKSIIYSVERKKSTLALELSQNKYSELFHLSPLPMLVFDLETFCILDANMASVKHYGYCHNEFLAMKVWELNPEGEATAMQHALQQLNNNACEQGIYMHKTKDGRLIKVDVRSNNIEFKGRPAKIILANDVTERLNYIKAIETQNEKLTEISWIQSHLVRAPVARLLGLTQLFAFNDNYDEKKQIAEYIHRSALELDEVIKHITETTNGLINENQVKSRSLLQLAS